MFNKKEHNKKYKREHKEQIAEYNKIWRRNNPYYQKEWKKRNNYQKEWRKGKQDLKNGEYNKKYRNTEKGKANNQRGKSKRRTREKGMINTLTAGEWINILKKYKFRCAYCGKEFTLFNRETRDHVIPISKGGDNTKENIVPACRSYNAKKNDKIII